MFLFFFVLLTEEFRFPVHAWVCRYYTYVRVFVNVHTMRFAILLHRQAFMYIHVHVLRGFQTYILLFSNLFSSASFFCFCFASYCCNCIAVSVYVCLWEKTLPLSFVRPIAIHVSTCAGCIGFLISCLDIPQAWRKASHNVSTLLLAEACLVSAHSLTCCIPCVPRVVSLRRFGNWPVGRGSQLHGRGLLAPNVCVILVRAVVLVKFKKKPLSIPGWWWDSPICGWNSSCNSMQKAQQACSSSLCVAHMQVHCSVHGGLSLYY